MFFINDKNSEFVNILIWMIISVSSLVLILGIGLFVMWIKYSWMDRGNSLNLTGRELTQKIFNENNLNLEIVSSFFYSKFWNHNKRRGTYKLRPWTHDRRSIWTMMEASQQAYATTIRETKPRQFWIAFRMPQIVMFAGGFIGIFFIAFGIMALKKSDFVDKYEYWKIVVGSLVMIAAVTYASCWRAWMLKRDVVPMISNIGFTDEELRIIQRIFNWAFLYAIGNAIVETLRIALQAAQKSQDYF